MSSGQREYDINADLDRKAGEREEQQANLELWADELLQVEPCSEEYEQQLFFRQYRKQILSVRIFIESIKHVD